MTQIFETAIANVQSAYPSIYSKEDVIRLIQDLGIAANKEQTNRPGISQEDVNMAIEQIREELISHISETDFSIYVELELNHTEIEINFDERGIQNAIRDAFDIATSQYVD